MFKKYWVVMFCLIVIFSINNILYAQFAKYPTGKRSTLLTGMFNFTIQPGTFYFPGGYYAITSFAPTPSFFSFVSNGFGLGGDIYFAHVNMVHGTQSRIRETILGIGPKFAYFIGGPESKIYPYLGMGFSFLHTSNVYHFYDDYFYDYDSFSTSGYRIRMGFGICPLISKNGCMLMEAGYLIDNLSIKGESVFGGTIYLGAGLGCFIF